MHEDDVFCNPMAPVDSETKSTTTVQKQNLSNEDFRKLAMTPSVNVASTPTFGSKHPSSSSVRGHRRQVIINEEFKKPESTASSTDKKKSKKKFYQKKEADEEENILAELAKRYRDRAKERREHTDEQDDHQMNTSNYNAVGNMSSEDAAERRRQLIEESKYLGGDMEHTHLVKGLDYALLQKVKTELEFERDQQTIKLLENELAKKGDDSEDDEDSDNEEDHWSIRSTLAQNLMKILFETNLPEKNDYFLPGRLAYVFDLENDCPTDAFTSVIRSKAECPNWESQNTLSASEIVLNKLIEIFEELRELGGKRRKKLKTQQIDQLEDSGKFNFINQSCDFGTTSNSGSVKDSARSSRSSLLNEVETKDLTDVYDQDLNFDVIKKTKATKVENDLDIYDDINEDYVLPHKLEKSKSERRRDSLSPRYSSSKYDDRDDRYHSSRYDDRDYDREYRSKRRSPSRERNRRSSSEEDRRDKYKERDGYRGSHKERESYSRSRKDDYHREDRHYSSSKKRRY